MNLRDVVREVLAEHVDLPEDDATPVHLESLALVLVVEELERRLDVRVGARDLVPDNFSSVAAVVRFLGRARP